MAFICIPIIVNGNIVVLVYFDKSKLVLTSNANVVAIDDDNDDMMI